MHKAASCHQTHTCCPRTVQQLQCCRPLCPLAGLALHLAHALLLAVSQSAAGQAQLLLFAVHPAVTCLAHRRRHAAHHLHHLQTMHMNQPEPPTLFIFAQHLLLSTHCCLLASAYATHRVGWVFKEKPMHGSSSTHERR